MPTHRLPVSALFVAAALTAVTACASPQQLTGSSVAPTTSAPAASDPPASDPAASAPAASAPAASDPPETPSAPTAGGGTDRQWAYEGEIGPDRWGDVPGAAVCRAGKAQSPVDLAGARVLDLPDPEVAYRPSRVGIVHLGHAVRADFGAGNSVGLGGTRYELLQLHQHTPAEHTLDGESAAAEMHLVHRSADDEYAVLGIRLVEGAANPAVEAFLDAAPAEEGATSAPTMLDASPLLPADRRLFRYDGSLTTPPCTEGVKWHVFAAPVTASAEQLTRLADLSGDNNRPIQQLGDRTLERDSRSG